MTLSCFASFVSLTLCCFVPRTCSETVDWLPGGPDSPDLREARVLLREKPEVADLKRFEPSFHAKNETERDSVARKKLVVSTVLEPPFVMLKKESYQIAGNDRFEGFLVDLLKQLSLALNFEYEIRLARDNKYGTVYANRFWDGAIGEVHRKEAAMAMGPIVVSEVMGRFVDFTTPFLSLRYSALMAKPKEGEEEIVDGSQLLASSMPLGMVRNGPLHQAISNSSLPVHGAIMAKLAVRWPELFVGNRQEGVERARSGNYAFLIDTPIAEYEAGIVPCDLYTSEPFLDLVEYALALGKDLLYETEGGPRSLKEAVDEEIVELKKNSDMQALYLYWWKDECVDQRKEGRKKEEKEEEEEGEGDYRVVEWISRETKGQKSQRAKSTDGRSSFLVRSGHNHHHHQQLPVDSSHHEQNESNRSAGGSFESRRCRRFALINFTMFFLILHLLNI